MGRDQTRHLTIEEISAMVQGRTKRANLEENLKGLHKLIVLVQS